MSDSSAKEVVQQKKKEMDQHEMCERNLTKILNQSSLLNIIMDEMGKVGCIVDPLQFFSCKQCPMAVEGFYDKNLGVCSYSFFFLIMVNFYLRLKVVICENHISPKVEKLTKTLLHESIHAFDYCNSNLDGDDCLHVACTEV